LSVAYAHQTIVGGQQKRVRHKGRV
jgi:hypothetical protein